MRIIFLMALLSLLPACYTRAQVERYAQMRESLGKVEGISSCSEAWVKALEKQSKKCGCPQ